MYANTNDVGVVSPHDCVWRGAVIALGSFTWFVELFTWPWYAYRVILYVHIWCFCGYKSLTAKGEWGLTNTTIPADTATKHMKGAAYSKCMCS
jgi:hypothetical protein